MNALISGSKSRGALVLSLSFPMLISIGFRGLFCENEVAAKEAIVNAINNEDISSVIRFIVLMINFPQNYVT